jgi:hypothetical protein
LLTRYLTLPILIFYQRLDKTSEDQEIELISFKWVYFIIQDYALLDAYHPLHLHGHDFYVLAQGKGIFIKGITPINLKNPPRRDTAIIPGNGYLVIAFYTDNPGYVNFTHSEINRDTAQNLLI